MKLLLTYLWVLCLLVGGWIALISAAPPPERLIVGTWQQTSWEYEKLDLPPGGVPADFLEAVKHSVGAGLIMHQAETWEFLPGQSLRVVNGEEVEVVQWRLKGRGHILQIIHDNGVTENYHLEKLNDSTLQLNIETNIQARGIARLVFNKTA